MEDNCATPPSGLPERMHMRRVSLHNLWKRFREASLEILVLRDFEHLPETVTSDLDIAVSNSSQRDIASNAILQFAKDENLEIVQLLRRSYVWEHKLFCQDGRELIIDLHFRGEGWRGPLYLSNQELFAAAVRRDAWLEPARHHQAMMAVFQHLLWGGIHRAKYHLLVPKWISGCQGEFSACVGRAFGSDIAPELVEKIIKADAVGLASLAGQLRMRLWIHRGLPDLPGSVSRLMAFIYREIVITLHRYGRWIVLVGPDGVGKTTVAAMLSAKGATFFRNVLYHHWIGQWEEPIPLKAPPPADESALREETGGLRATALSLLRLARNVARAHLAYWFRILPSLLRQRLVIGDRYLFNYFLIPKSVRYYGPEFAARWAMHLIPKPDLILCLHAAPAEIRRRKPELSLEEIERVIERSKQLPSLGFRSVMISAEADAAVVAQAAHSYILGVRN